MISINPDGTRNQGFIFTESYGAKDYIVIQGIDRHFYSIPKNMFAAWLIQNGIAVIYIRASAISKTYLDSAEYLDNQLIEFVDERGQTVRMSVQAYFDQIPNIEQRQIARKAFNDAIRVVGYKQLALSEAEVRYFSNWLTLWLTYRKIPTNTDSFTQFLANKLSGKEYLSDELWTEMKTLGFLVNRQDLLINFLEACGFTVDIVPIDPEEPDEGDVLEISFNSASPMTYWYVRFLAQLNIK